MFEGPKLKIKRANQHIANFNDVLNAFIKTDFYIFDIEENVETGQNSLIFKITCDPPCGLPLILGDAVHNLRAALDLGYIELLTEIGKVPSKWSTLRVYENRQKLIDILSKGILEGAPDIVAMLADTVKAYVGGDALLSALDSLDISDKHVLLIPVFSVSRLTNVDVEIITAVGGRIVMTRCTVGVAQGGVLNIAGFPGPGKIHFQNKGQPTISVLFGKGTGLEGQPVIPTITQFCQLVSGILKIFENSLIARKPATI